MILCAGCTEPAAPAPTLVLAPAPTHALAPAPTPPPTPALPVESEIRRWQARADEVAVRVSSPTGSGSGVIVSRDGLIVTASHVVDVDDEQAIVVTLADGTALPATVAGRHPAHDLLLLHVPQPLPTCASPASDVRTGAWTLCSGAVGVEHSETDASIGLVISPENGSRWIDTSCTIGRGMSGGPALDVEGHLVGVAVSFTGTTSRLARLSGEASLLRDAACDAGPFPAITLPSAGPDRRTALRAIATAEPPSASVVFVTFLTPRYGPSLRGVAGIVVAPGVVLTVTSHELAWDELGAPRSPLSIEGDPTAHAVRGETKGELALIHFDGLSASPIAPVRSSFAVGTLVAAATSHDLGIVSRVDATPGRVEPFLGLPASRCGRRSMYMRQAFPVATLPHAFVHDASAHRGELLVDAAGVPLGIHVTAQGGIGFAVPLADALASF